MLREFRDLIPKLELALTKGQSGRIGIIGGSEEYTGAPYFAAIASLRTGADLCHVFCAKEAARVIKSYSPELIVHSSFQSDQETLSQTILDQICRLDMLVIGPGLGRNVKTITAVMSIISIAREHKMPLIIDAVSFDINEDGLFIVTQNPNMIKGYEKCIITPNVVELGRLKRALVSNIITRAYLIV
jgi:ATP-dependent NAD(P)H-hydrate dehydratase